MKEIIIYIHGINPDIKPKNHIEQYDNFEQNLKKALVKSGKNYPQHRIDIEWGSNLPQILTQDKILADTERKIFRKLRKLSEKIWDFTLNPLRIIHNLIRKSFILGFADLFYYISEDGKEEIRKNVLGEILNKINDLGNDDEYILTIISHSAGTIIMHDLLFIIFGGSSRSYLSKAADKKLLKKFINMAKKGKLRIKLFVTLGSPITPLIVRSGNMLRTIHSDKVLEPRSIGIRCSSSFDSKWLNFWDKDDVISYPLSFLYDNSGKMIEDIYVDTGDFFPWVHNYYWGSKKIAKIIADKMN
jgi:hypothetical protein